MIKTESNKNNINKGNKILKSERSRSKGKKSNNKKEEPKNKPNKNNKNDKIPPPYEPKEENDNGIDDGEEEDWNYMKRTMAKRDGKIMNDEESLRSYELSKGKEVYLSVNMSVNEFLKLKEKN